MSELTIITLEGDYALCRLIAGSTIPDWCINSFFYTVTKTTEEVSVLCEAKYVPSTIQYEKGWKLLKIDAVLNLSLTGITAKFSTALAEAGINLCVIATYDTDYILVKEEKLIVALEALQNAGFIIR